MKVLTLVLVRFFGILILPAYSLQAQTMLIVSDIDDTLKMTNVRASLPVMLSYATKTKDQSFYGMSDLLNSLACQTMTNPDCSRPHDERVTKYVTAAQGMLSTFGKKTLEEDGFPKGEVFARGYSEDKYSFKVGTIVELFEKIKPDILVLLGDNGELDPAAYAGVEDTLRSLGYSPYIYSYIHMINPILGTDDKLYPNQHAYITAIDLAAAMVSDGLLPAEEFDRLFVELWQHWSLASSKLYERMMPSYFKCSDWFQGDGQDLYNYDLNASVFGGSVWTSYVNELGFRCLDPAYGLLISQN